MHARRHKRTTDTVELTASGDLANKHQQFVEKMQNPLNSETKAKTEDTVDGNVLSLRISASAAPRIPLDELPDGSHISPVKIVPTKDRKSVKEVEYIGSFSVVENEQNKRVEVVKSKLTEMRDVSKRKPVLLVISLSGVKVCNSSGESVYMAHALKRISYATCDPSYHQFSFLAREPKSDTSVQYCHVFLTRTSEEAEELNAIIGQAFTAAFSPNNEQDDDLATNGNETATFNDVIEQQLCEQRERTERQREQREQQLASRLSKISTPTVDEQIKERKENRRRQMEEVEKQRENDRMRGKERMSWAKQIVGRTKHKAPYNITDSPCASLSSLQLNISTLSDSSPKLGNGTDMPLSPVATTSENSPSSSSTTSSGGLQKFRNIMELREAMESGELRSYGSPVMTLKDTIDNRLDPNGEFGFLTDGGSVGTSSKQVEGQRFIRRWSSRKWAKWVKSKSDTKEQQ